MVVECRTTVSMVQREKECMNRKVSFTASLDSLFCDYFQLVHSIVT